MQNNHPYRAMPMTIRIPLPTAPQVGAHSLALVLALGISPATSAEAPRTGEQVYEEVCSLCHNTGVENAPRFGDKTAWAPLIKEGQPTLTAHAWVGVRGMPPRGGRPDLSLEEFARATAYMARAAGGNWQDPAPAVLDQIRNEERKRLDQLNKGS